VFRRSHGDGRVSQVEEDPLQVPEDMSRDWRPVSDPALPAAFCGTWDSTLLVRLWCSNIQAWPYATLSGTVRRR